ncbi:LCP family protein [Limosilactobacillus sp.]|uniref:LCP family protein n=1 Tax=Limosilactobacillus sp. TaxID=2773925 RepID=UPI003F037F96
MKREQEKHRQRTRRLFANRPVWWCLLTIIILGILILFSYEYRLWHSTVHQIHTSNESSQATRLIKERRPFSVLAMGTDVGALGRGTSYAGNTDTMEVITVNPQQKRVTMVAVPRDTLVKVTTKDGTRYVKINATYAIGGPRLAKKQVSELLGVPINFYALTNMGTLKKVVNAVGGVNVNNPFAFTYEGHHFKKGWQHLNGRDALKYSRMRYDDPNNDYGRQRRGQQVLQSVISSFKKHGSLTAANEIITAAQDGVRTDLPLDHLSRLYLNYRSAMDQTHKDHLQGKDAQIDGTDFQIATAGEINRVSKELRQSLGLSPHHVVNNETRMNKHQTNWNGYNQLDYRLPGNAQYNVLIRN